MAFMEPEVIHGEWYVVETNQGDFIIPSDVCKGSQVKEYFPEGIGSSAKITGFAIKKGWGARLQAPGYMDSTGWQGLYETVEEAMEALCESFDLCETCFENDCTCEEEGEN